MYDLLRQLRAPCPHVTQSVCHAGLHSAVSSVLLGVGRSLLSKHKRGVKQNELTSDEDHSGNNSPHASIRTSGFLPVNPWGVDLIETLQPEQY